MQLKSHHYCLGSDHNVFTDVLVFDKTVRLALWKYAPNVSNVTLLSDAEWTDRLTNYPGQGAGALGRTIGAKIPDATYVLYSTILFDPAGEPFDFGKGEWVDHADWLFPIDKFLGLTAPVNQTMEATVGKNRSPRYLRKVARGCVLQAIIPFTNRNFQDCTFSLCVDERHGFASNLTDWVEVDIDKIVYDHYNVQFFPNLYLSGPTEIKAGGTATLTLELKTQDQQPLPGEKTVAYLEAVAGYLPHKRAEVSGDAPTEVRVMALGLLPGEEMRIKVGFRHYTGTSEVILKVVE